MVYLCSLSGLVSNDNITMSIFHLIYAIWGLLSFTCFFVVVICASWCPYQNLNQRFEQKTDKFWVFSEQTETWVEAKLPYDLLSCVDGDCRKVGSILQSEKKTTQQVLELEDKLDEQKISDENKDSKMESEDVVLPQRKRISLTKISETSMWVTGESGSIYERFWNGMEWVILSHDLPVSAGSAVSVFVINQTILALSEAGKLYQVKNHPFKLEYTYTCHASYVKYYVKIQLLDKYSNVKRVGNWNCKNLLLLCR